MSTNLILGDCRQLMRDLDAESVDAIVCDPPYELSFMGKSWDSTGVAYDPETWQAALRVLKPGGHLLAFGGARTYHRMACAIEDAGAEIRDQIMWVYGSGFPKSLDVSKAIDKAAGAQREVVGIRVGHEDFINRTDKHSAGARREGWDRPWKDDPEKVRAHHLQTAPATPEAQEWAGWGTALKPAHEPICVARKPLQGTVAANVLEFGTGALNIDGCRVAAFGRPLIESRSERSLNAFGDGLNGSRQIGTTDDGRWPANLIHDGSPEVLAMFPETSSGKAHILRRGSTTGKGIGLGSTAVGHEASSALYGDAGCAARFFQCCPFTAEERAEQFARLYYCAKASKADRGAANTHATVKPLSLMRYLVRLVTPPGGLVLDPFAGSGTTGRAALAEGFGFVGMELDPGHLAIAQARIAAAGVELPLLAGVAS